MWFTINDLIEEYTERDFPIKEDNGQNVINTSKVEKNLESAEIFVKSYLETAKVFQKDVDGNEIPLSPNQVSFIREPVLTIARYYYSDETTGEGDIIVKRYESAISMLNKIAKGEISFPKNPLTSSKSNTLFNINIIRG